MAGNNGNGHTEAPADFKDLTIDGVKALFPDFGSAPLMNINSDSRNPGTRLINNDEKLDEMLKVVYFRDEDLARNANEALSECEEFELGPDGKTNDLTPLVNQRKNWVKNLCAALCSVNGRWADIYKQTAIGVATTAVTDKGSSLLSMPIGKERNLSQQNNDNRNNNGRKP